MIRNEYGNVLNEQSLNNQFNLERTLTQNQQQERRDVIMYEDIVDGEFTTPQELLSVNPPIFDLEAREFYSYVAQDKFRFLLGGVGETNKIDSNLNNQPSFSYQDIYDAGWILRAIALPQTVNVHRQLPIRELLALMASLTGNLMHSLANWISSEDVEASRKTETVQTGIMEGVMDIKRNRTLQQAELKRQIVIEQRNGFGKRLKAVFGPETLDKIQRAVIAERFCGWMLINGMALINRTNGREVFVELLKFKGRRPASEVTEQLWITHVQRQDGVFVSIDKYVGNLARLDPWILEGQDFFDRQCKRFVIPREAPPIIGCGGQGLAGCDI